MRLISKLIGVALLLNASAASALVLDFEGFAAGTIIDDEYFTTFGVTISAINSGSSPDIAVVFDSNNPTGGDSDLGAPFAPAAGNPFGSISPGNLLILQENNCPASGCVPDDQGARPAGTISFVFENAVMIESLDFFDIEGPEIGDVVLYDALGNTMATFAIPDTGGDNFWARLIMNVDGVSAIDVNMGGSGAIDNLQFSPVPVPAALPLFFGGLTLLGFMRRRRS
ncbi:MAG: PEP-CTERM sorting domain-containing protein [Gammaproteobacteria bacterium]|nr:PEP-CTERM sorting domain-containing protein [Gammaproteobacteria bacterium]